jgi:hypothetical protein
MDPAASAAATPAAGSGLKKQPKVRKPAKDLTPEERRKESQKRAGQREAVKNRQNATRLEEERRLENERFLAAQALANSEELAGKVVVRAVMMKKQEAINVTFGGVASPPPSSAVGDALSTSSVTSTPSGCPPALEPNTPIAHALALGAHCRGSAVLSQFGDLRPTSGSAGQASTSTRHCR